MRNSQWDRRGRFAGRSGELFAFENGMTGQGFSRSAPGLLSRPFSTEVENVNAGASLRDAAGSVQAKRKQSSWPVFLFIAALVVPWIISVGPLRLSLYRFVLLAMLVPCVVAWITGKAGRIRLADISLLLCALWPTLSLVVNHGWAIAVQTGGIGFLEAFGAYLLARCYIRDADDFHNAVKLLFGTVLFLMPFAFVECVSGQNVLREMFGMIVSTGPSYSHEYRSGFARVQSVFEHSILFGVYVGSSLALVHLVLGYQKSLFQRFLKDGIVTSVALTSLSAGPIGGVVAMTALLSWNGLLRSLGSRWKILIGLLVCLFVALQSFANRSALTILTSFFIFDPASYWYRRLIWQYGTENVANHPIFGLGMNDWERPAWMPAASIDNFFLVQAVHWGLPAPIFLMLAFFLIVVAVALKKDLDEKLVDYRTGFILAMVFFFLVGWSVAFWGSTYVVFLFLLGSGVWILEARATPITREESAKWIDGSIQGSTTELATGVPGIPAIASRGSIRGVAGGRC
ncbi:hypothetical protein FJ987_23415 [Mesorhizobium sp. CU2]|uniref:hypothetical protein n=1 Tax=unclassified Mesorhizobium TaxID=325217 RepID=UPI0011289866|nr:MULTISPECIES: hypothetical protein [unclassified Mesorhizobium]TPN88494.1 hypothetical protein FJ988_05460 [Mesorhizobium sp. CU3]TPO08192.1 hypothetical protein FJ987_23415 [Mesorhizobium sp. CU2]